MKVYSRLILVIAGCVSSVCLAVPQFNVPFTGDPVGSAPVTAPATPGVLNTHPTYVAYSNTQGGSIRIGNTYHDTHTSTVFGSGNVAVFDMWGAPQTAQMYFTANTSDAAVKGSDVAVSVEFDLYVDSYERYGGNAGYYLYDSSWTVIGGITHNWDNPGSYAGIGYYDNAGVGQLLQAPVLTPGIAHHIKWIIDVKNWKYTTIIDGKYFYGPWGLLPTGFDFNMFGIDAWSASGIGAYDSIKIGINSSDCNEVLAMGQQIRGDFNKDCKVDLKDLQVVVSNWLTCNDPCNPGCTAARKTIYADQVNPGWNATDATACLQNAINSDADIVVVRNMGSDWNVKPINIKGTFCGANKEIQFQNGVVLAAKQGEFLDKWACLVNVESCNNVTLNGYGATLKMRKSDYLSPPYLISEQRHALRIAACNGVTVKGLTMRDSGGDGVIIVSDANTYLKDITCDNNYRQGISVISATNFLVENCVFKNTIGTAPQAGVDIEPDEATEKFVNVVFRGCQFNNNQGDGIAVYCGALNNTSTPLDITFDTCTVSGGAAYGFGANGIPDNGVGGTIKFKNCTATGTALAGMYLLNKSAVSTAAKVTFDNCAVANCATTVGAFPVAFNKTFGEGYSLSKIGNAEFINNCSVTDNVNRAAVAANAAAKGIGLQDIHGTIKVTNPYGVSSDLGSNLTNVDLQVIP